MPKKKIVTESAASAAQLARDSSTAKQRSAAGKTLQKHKDQKHK